MNCIAKVRLLNMFSVEYKASKWLVLYPYTFSFFVEKKCKPRKSRGKTMTKNQNI